MVKLVMIEWLDSTQPISQWQHLSDYNCTDVIKCISVGFLVHDSKKIKGLAPNLGDVDKENNIQASGIIHIPVCSITKITALEEKE